MNLKDADLPPVLVEYIEETITRVHEIRKALVKCNSRDGAVAFKNLLMIPLGSLNKEFELPPNTLEGMKKYLSEPEGFGELKRINMMVTVRLRKGPAPAPQDQKKIPLEVKVTLNENSVDFN